MSETVLFAIALTIIVLVALAFVFDGNSVRIPRSPRVGP
jgi:hypothetical protein